MILVGIDDTDILGSKGTNQLARAIVSAVANDWRCIRIVRHQLFFDPRVPYTSKNGSASITFEPRHSADVGPLIETCRRVMREWYVVGSDPGLCVTADIPEAITAFGRRTQTEVVSQAEARSLASKCGLHCEGLGGTEDGVIGAVAAAGLAVTGDDGRIIQLGEWSDDLSGMQPLENLRLRDVEVQDLETATPVEAGFVDLGKRLRPNLRRGRSVLFVQPNPTASQEKTYRAVKLP